MTTKEVATMVASIGIPYAYYQFPEGTEQSCPFICFFFSSSDDLVADNTNYQPIRQLSIELYTDDKDYTTEATVETTLNTSGLVYSREETYLGSERMYMVTYTTEIVITEENNNVNTNEQS